MEANLLKLFKIAFWYVPENLRLQTIERVLVGILFRFPEQSDVIMFYYYTDNFHNNAFPVFQAYC
ncbi:MAG: hypothetical protein ACFFCV_07255 [Promethearchaeota archaeon]